MSYELPETLARLLDSPLRQQVKLGVSAKQLATRLMQETKGSTPHHPDTDAIWFYSLNQMVALITKRYSPSESLPAWAANIVQTYVKELKDQHKRLVWYTFLVTSREWRHQKYFGEAWVTNHPSFPKEMEKMKAHLADSSDDATLNSWLKFVPDIPLESYATGLVTAFNNGNWSSGYGGKPWGMIAKSLVEYAKGATSAEMFVDTAWTLAHNNGPMFNKLMIYTSYTEIFLKILDIQRSGQMCEAVQAKEFKSYFSLRDEDKLFGMIARVKKELGGIGEYVDYYKVVASGAKQSYIAELDKQKKTYGIKPKKALVDGKPVKFTTMYMAEPSVELQVYERMKV